MSKQYGAWKDRKVLFIGDSLTARLIGDQLHKSPAGYQRIGEVIAGSLLAAYGN